VAKKQVAILGPPARPPTPEKREPRRPSWRVSSDGRAGLNVDLQEMEFGAVVKRRTSQSPPRQGRQERFLHPDRSLDPEPHPFGNPALRADGKAA
jgi:hypothetical protein